jgi:hypothetical protein
MCRNEAYDTSLERYHIEEQNGSGIKARWLKNIIENVENIHPQIWGEIVHTNFRKPYLTLQAMKSGT